MTLLDIPSITLLGVEDDAPQWVFKDGELLTDLDEEDAGSFMLVFETLNLPYEHVMFPYDVVFDLVYDYMQYHGGDYHNEVHRLPVVRNFVQYARSVAAAEDDDADDDDTLSPYDWYLAGQPTVYTPPHRAYDDDDDDDWLEKIAGAIDVEPTDVWGNEPETPATTPTADIPAATQWPNADTFKDWGTAP